jgi:hypothetical protein
VGHYTVRWEEEGVWRPGRRPLGLPPLRSVLAAMGPASIGFLAFEYGKELVIRKAELEEANEEGAQQ